LWAISMVVTLGTIALLVVQLYPGLWEDVSREPVALLKGRVATLISIGVALMVLFVLLAMGSASLGWTGFENKTIWDWLQLLIVPLMLALITVVFTWQQNVRQNELEDQRAQQAQKIENQRAEAERELADQRAQDEALQAYLSQMGSLLLEKNLRESKEDSEERTLARARTLTVLGRMDPSRKEAVIQFLDEAELVHRVEGRGSIVMLGSADLRGAVLSDPDVNDPNLAANLSGAHLVDAKLRDVELGFANLRYADLRDANLPYTDLRNAELGHAKLRDANLRQADLRDVNLYVADLVGANLSGADLAGVNLRFANLSDANLSDANLSDANLSGANLSGARGVTDERLETLEGATMPNGQKYEDWLKDKEGSAEDGKNSGPS
jgi:uncharacterized protein YjbI with pentapeptide repeats